MTETVTVRIGGEDIALPLIANFAALKRAWPALLAWSQAVDPIAEVSSGLSFIAAILVSTRPDLTQPVLEARLDHRKFKPDTYGEPIDFDERAGVNRVVREVAEGSGLIPRRPPEPPAAPMEQAESPSTATGTTSSPS